MAGSGNGGLTAERTLIAGLEKRGFRLAPQTAQLDERYKVDRIVLAPPRGDHLFPHPLALQVTTWPGQWIKRADFCQAARATRARLVYVELARLEVTDEVVDAVGLALQTLFYQTNVPQTALVTLNEDGYNLHDLAAALERYRQWLTTPIAGELYGTMQYWIASKNLGFIVARLPSVDDPRVAMEISVFCHGTQVADQDLRTQLSGFEGDLNGPDRVQVVFQDGGWPDPAHWRRHALQVRRAEAKQS